MVNVNIIDDVDAAPYDLTNGQGETLTLNLTVDNPNINFSGSTVKLHITTVYFKRLFYPGTVTNNSVRILVTDEDTVKWPIGKHDYHVSIYPADGQSRQLIHGKLKVS